MQGANVIIITDKPEQFSEIEEIHIVDDWLKSWDIVDRLVGEKRRMLDLNEWHENPSEFDAFEMYVGGGIMDRGLLWFDYGAKTSKERNDVQAYMSDIKHIVVLLDGADLFLTTVDVQKKWDDTAIKDFIVGPPESTSTGWIILFYGSESKTGSTRGVFGRNLSLFKFKRSWKYQNTTSPVY